MAARWTHVLKKGLTSDEVRKLTETYPPPENCTMIGAWKLNAEVNAVVQEATINRDNRIFGKKDACQRLGIAASRLIVATQREEALIRRSLNLMNLNAPLKQTLLSSSTNEWLFGHDLEEKLKTAKTLERSSEDSKAQTKTQQTKTLKNLKASPRQPNNKNNQMISGGNKKTYTKKPHRRKPYVRRDQKVRRHH